MININEYIKKLQNSQNLQDFYNKLDEINNKLSEEYPQIQCKTACNRCCKFYGSPEIFDFEWDNIKTYIEENFTEIDFKRIKKKLNDGFDYYQSNISKNSPESFFECPFIYKNQCSIYEKRPFICRIFGYAKVSHKLLTCNEEIQQFKNNIPNFPEKSDLEVSLLSNPNINKEQKVRTIVYHLKKYFS